MNADERRVWTAGDGLAWLVRSDSSECFYLHNSQGPGDDDFVVILDDDVDALVAALTGRAEG